MYAEQDHERPAGKGAASRGRERKRERRGKGEGPPHPGPAQDQALPRRQPGASPAAPLVYEAGQVRHREHPAEPQQHGGARDRGRVAEQLERVGPTHIVDQ